MPTFSKQGDIEERWRYDVQGSLLAGPMVYDIDNNGRKEIIFGTKDGRVVMIDGAGDVQWTYTVEEADSTVERYFQDPESPNSIVSAPAIADIDDDGMNEVVFGTEHGSIYVLDHQGNEMWKYETEGPVRATPRLHDIDGDRLQEVIVGDMAGYLYVIGARGQLEETIHIGSAMEGTPGLLEDSLVVGCHDGTIRRVDGEDEHWRFSTRDKVVASPVICDLYNNGEDVILVGSTDYALYAIDSVGEELWRYDTEGAIIASVTVADIDTDGALEVVFGSCDNSVYAATNSGDTIWSYETYFWVAAPPIVADIDDDGKNEVVVGSYDNSVYVLDSEGQYSLDYVPGLGGVVHQSGQYADVMTREPGDVHAEKIWQYRTPGHVVGCSFDDDHNDIIVNVKEGDVESLFYKEK